ncbi:hypothetical protein EJ06DRAFT_259528 [Trichodelitschia bisporula]|uniref:Uncharacterized protein n=1 Tax=Trichodelitschia bisporula TaxID=703511 RepID=A0A6G1HIH9_9PEZI|nr:hypothetical protein EJ06DRAFT_259528 [Trichodelitschia bisporula]
MTPGYVNLAIRHPMQKLEKRREALKREEMQQTSSSKTCGTFHCDCPSCCTVHCAFVLPCLPLPFLSVRPVHITISSPTVFCASTPLSHLSQHTPKRFAPSPSPLGWKKVRVARPAKTAGGHPHDQPRRGAKPRIAKNSAAENATADPPERPDSARPSRGVPVTSTRTAHAMPIHQPEHQRPTTRPRWPIPLIPPS